MEFFDLSPLRYEPVRSDNSDLETMDPTRTLDGVETECFDDDVEPLCLEISDTLEANGNAGSLEGVVRGK